MHVVDEVGEELLLFAVSALTSGLGREGHDIGRSWVPFSLDFVFGAEIESHGGLLVGIKSTVVDENFSEVCGSLLCARVIGADGDGPVLETGKTYCSAPSVLAIEAKTSVVVSALLGDNGHCGNRQFEIRIADHVGTIAVEAQLALVMLRIASGFPERAAFSLRLVAPHEGHLVPGEVVELKHKHHGKVPVEMLGPRCGAQKVLLAIEADGGMSVQSPAKLLGLTGSHGSTLVSRKVRPFPYKSARCVEGARIKVKLQTVLHG